jgi:hypothetical protein
MLDHIWRKFSVHWKSVHWKREHLGDDALGQPAIHSSQMDIPLYGHAVSHSHVTTAWLAPFLSNER